MLKYKARGQFFSIPRIPPFFSPCLPNRIANAVDKSDDNTTPVAINHKLYGIVNTTGRALAGGGGSFLMRKQKMVKRRKTKCELGREN